MVHIFGKALLSITATLPIASCTGFYTPLEHLVGHEHALVSVPANVGARVMGVIGIPIAIAAMPVTAHPALIGDCGLAPLAPIFVVAQIGAIALGGVPWLIMDLPVQLFCPDRSQPPSRESRQTPNCRFSPCNHPESLCQLVPRCARQCHVVPEPIAHSIAH